MRIISKDLKRRGELNPQQRPEGARKTNPLMLDVLVMKEGNWWVAQCLQYDLTAQANELPELQYKFEYALVGHVVTSLENKLEPFDCLPPAPQKYWDAWKKALRVEPSPEPRFRVPRHIPKAYIPRVKEFRVGDLVA